MQITRDHIKKTLKLDQISYADKVIKCFKLNNAKIACTTLPSGYNPLPNTTQSTPHLEVAINPLSNHSFILCWEHIQILHKRLSRCHNSLLIHLKNICRKHFILCSILLVPRISASNMMELVKLVLWHTLRLTGQVIMKLVDQPLDMPSSEAMVLSLGSQGDNTKLHYLSQKQNMSV